jgi:hypothetical protein
MCNCIEKNSKKSLRKYFGDLGWGGGGGGGGGRGGGGGGAGGGGGGFLL